MKKPILIIIPAYNEKKTIGGLIGQIQSGDCGKYCDILVVNDASTDGTNFLSKQMGVSVITHVFNLGYGSALQIGYKYAVRYGYDYVIQMDADGQHDVCNIAAIYGKLREEDDTGACPDIVVGSRFLPGSVSFPVSGLKKLAITIFRKLIRSSTGRTITDPTSGLQGISRRALLYYSQYKHFDYRYPDANMLMEMLLHGYRVEEVPAIMHAREFGTSMHSGLKPVFYMLTMMTSILNVFIRARMEKHRQKHSKAEA